MFSVFIIIFKTRSLCQVAQQGTLLLRARISSLFCMISLGHWFLGAVHIQFWSLYVCKLPVHLYFYFHWFISQILLSKAMYKCGTYISTLHAYSVNTPWWTALLSQPVKPLDDCLGRHILRGRIFSQSVSLCLGWYAPTVKLALGSRVGLVLCPVLPCVLAPSCCSTE